MLLTGLYNIVILCAQAAWLTTTVIGRRRYNLTATVRQESGAPLFATTRTVGFRVMSLVTTNDTDATERASDAGADGSGKLGVLWRVNGETTQHLDMT